MSAAPLLLMLLAACGAPDNDVGPGEVSAGEADMLNDAAEMLDERAAPGTVPSTTSTDHQDAPRSDER